MKHFCALVLLAVLAGCVQPDGAPVKIFVGATLVEPGRGAVIEHSIVIVDDGIVTAAGPQASVPVPQGSRKISGLGRFLYPLDPAQPIRAGQNANFGLYSVNPAVDPAYPRKLLGRMVGAKWEPAP